MSKGGAKVKRAYKTFRQIYKIPPEEESKRMKELPFRPEVEIFPYRLPSEETLTKFLLKVREVRGIAQITMNGPRIYYERKINVVGKVIPLKIQVSKFWIELESFDGLEKLKDICNEIFHYGFSTRIGRFTRDRESLSGRNFTIRTDFLKGEK